MTRTRYDSIRLSFLRKEAYSLFALFASCVTSHGFSVDFRSVSSLPTQIAPSGNYQQQDLYLRTVQSEQVLAVDNAGKTNPWGLMLQISGLSMPVGEAPYLVFHYKLESPKAAGGVINFRFQATINGIKTEWNPDTQTGVLNLQMAADKSGWALATVDLRGLYSHWKRETGYTGPMNLQAVQIGPGAIDTLVWQYWGIVYFRGFRIGPASLQLGLDPAILNAAAFTDGADAWIPQGESISFTPIEAGEVFLTKELDVFLSDPGYLNTAARRLMVFPGQTYTMNTLGLESGTYDLMMVRNGVVEDRQQLHLAMTRIPVSPDYEVTVTTASGVTENLATGYSYGKSVYYMQGQPVTFSSNNRPVLAHSWAEISTIDYPITVRVRVKPGAQAISLPLTSAKVLPSSSGIFCTLSGSDTIEFTLDRPEKVLLVPNHQKAWEVYEVKAVGHVPIQSWRDNFSVETRKDSFHALNPVGSLSEGYRNPFVFLARGPDTHIPDVNSHGILYVNPGDQPSQDTLDSASIVWFKKGVHDFSRLGTAPLFHTYIRPGQTYYLEEGAYLLARIVKDDRYDPTPCFLVGRGTISGINHFWGWAGFSMGSQIIEVDVISGINVIDRSYFGIEGGDLVEDLAMLGSWHGNCDGLDSLDHCTVRDCFLMAHDDNLKINNHTRAEDIVIYMLGTNAHPIMFKEILTGVVFENSIIKDVDIIGDWRNPRAWNSGWSALGPGAIACLTGSDLTIRNVTFSDIRIESPWLYRIFSFFNMDTNQGYVPDWFNVPTSLDVHTRINGITFENITVNSPLIATRSILGSAYSGSMKNLSFANIDINGVRVTESNKESYFEIANTGVPDEVLGLSFHDSLYAAWAHRFSLQLGPDGDDDKDGLLNLAEFALGGNPVDPANLGYSPELTLEGGTICFTYPALSKRNSGLAYTVEKSDNFSDWEAIDGEAQIVGTSLDFNFHAYRIPLESTGPVFLRLKIQQ